MKPNKAKIGLIALVALGMAAACTPDAPKPPRIVLTEVGHDNSHAAQAGDDLHLEATLEAEGVIAEIAVALEAAEGGYALRTTFDDGKYIGVKNTEFHEHIDIPAEAPAGNYRLTLAVADREGQRAQAEATVTVINTPSRP